MTHSDFSDRAGTYAQLKHSIVELICDPDLISYQANFSAAISAATGWHWVGFYRVVGDELVLGPFQGPVACTRLRREQGVCSAAWRTAKTVLDIDSIEIDDFCAEDARELEALLNEVCDALLPSHS